MNIIYSKQAVKAISRMDSATKRRIRQGIEALPVGNVRPMEGFTDGRKRLRIGKYRVIYILSDNMLDVLEIGSRGDIYK